jgi:photoactive yellow protein
MQAMMAREEKLQRELGVSSPEEVVEMVEGLADQLEDLYANIDAASQQVDSDGQTGEKLERLLEREQRLQQELGISDPEQIADMVGGLADQLDDLYSARERLMELGAESPEDAANMMQSMREQLESLYETQERMSDQGVDSVDQALSMIDSMEDQLSDLYDERKKLLDKGLDPTGDTADQVAEMESRLQELSAEKEALQERRDTLEQEKETYESIVRSLQQEFGTADPEQLARLIRSMEEQLNEAYEEKEQDTTSRRTHLSEAPAFVPDDVLDAIDRLSDDELDALPFGAVALDDRGTVQFINEAAADLPGLGHRIGQRSEAEGQNFFRDLAPGANNNLFRGRFTEGVREDALDVCFPYTFVNPKAPPANLIVHMYRGADHNWLFFEAA